MPRIRPTHPADRTPGAHRNSKYMSQTSQPLPPQTKNLGRFFFLGALSSKETVPTTLTISSKETQRQTRKQQPSCSTSEFQVLDYTAIPIPTPETGIRPTLAQVLGHSSDIDYPGSTLTLPISTMTSAGSASAVHFPFVPASPTSATTKISLALSASASPSSPSSTIRSSISRTAITLLGVGAGCLALFVIILIKVCTRPRHHARPTPSLPILDEKYLGDLESQESPLFGGNERLSSKTDFNDLPSYASQPSSLSRPAQVAACDMGCLPNEYGAYSRLLRQQEKMPFTDSMSVCNPRCSRSTCGLPRPPQSSTRQPPCQQVQDAIIQTMKRLSSVSFSLYPGSPNYEVGIAFGGHDTPLTGDGCFPVSRPKSKNYRSRRNRQSHASAHDCAEQDAPSTIQYEHAVIASPPLVRGGRTRIKSSYYAHSRISLPMALSKARVDILPEATEPDKENDALGQASSLASSDPHELAADSAEESGEKKELHEVSDDQFKPAILLTPDPGAALGALLISEYHNEINRSDAKEEPRPYGDTPAPGLRFNGNGKKPSQECRAPDKPPRVPSPPPLPSLAQMAMEHRNQDDFENYRSPTYSIYGLYDGDGKSLY